MKAFLVQHGDAKPEEEDPLRPLSEKGREEVTRVARYLGMWRVEVQEIYHSGKLRARETAEIFRTFLSPSGDIIESPGLAPNDDPLMAYEFIRNAQKPLMIIGHLPHLARLVGFLLTGRGDTPIVSFRMGGVVCLEKQNDEFALRWIFTPDLALF